MTLTANTSSTGIEGAPFKPVAYALDRQTVGNLALVVVYDSTGQEEPATFGDVLRMLAEQQEQDSAKPVDELLRSWTQRQEREIPTTIGAVLQGLAERQVKALDVGSDVVYVTTDTIRIKVRGSEFNLQVLAMLLTFQIEGVDAFCATWFFYDEETAHYVDHYVSFVDDSYIFFVVHDGKIYSRTLLPP